MARFTETLRQVLHKFNTGGGLDVRMVDVATDLGRNRATIHKHLSRLVELGYIARSEYGLYRITPEGKRALEHRLSAKSYIRCPDCGRKITV